MQLQQQREQQEQQQQQQQQQYPMYGGEKTSSLYDSNFDYYEENGITEPLEDPGSSGSNNRMTAAIIRRRQLLKQQKQLALQRNAGYGASNQGSGFNSFLNEDYGSAVGAGGGADYGSGAALNRGGLGLGGLDYDYNDLSGLGGGIGGKLRCL